MSAAVTALAGMKADAIVYLFNDFLPHFQARHLPGNQLATLVSGGATTASLKTIKARWDEAVTAFETEASAVTALCHMTADAINYLFDEFLPYIFSSSYVREVRSLFEECICYLQLNTAADIHTSVGTPTSQT